VSQPLLARHLLLSYAERSRVIPHRRPVPLPPGHGAAGGPSRPKGSGFSASPPPRYPFAMYVLSPFVRAK
jgi:hypothetical protein